MQIACQNCEPTYQVEPSAVGPTGRSVRCARCRNVWFAANTEALSEIAASHRAEMAQFTASGPDSDPAADWPEPAAELATDEPKDVGFVHDAPPIAGDSGPSDLAAGADAPPIASPPPAPPPHPPA